MKKQFLLLFLLTVAYGATAQFRPYKDYVYLNNGSVIKGTIHFNEPDSTILIDTPSGCTFAFTKKEVLKYELSRKETFQRSKGLILRSGISAGILVFYDNDICFNADMSASLIYRTGSLYEIGLECSFILAPDITMNSIAVQLAQRCYFSRKPISPYLDLKIGLCMGKRTSLPNTYPSYYWYQEQSGYVSRDVIGELGVGVSLQNLDLGICGALSPYTKGWYYANEYRKGDPSFTFSLRVCYSFPLN